MPPVGAESREADYIADLVFWNRQTGLGKVFSSSTIFSLPNGGDRSPDAAWVRLDRWNALTPEQQERFPPICPDFVIELRSRTVRSWRSEADRLKPLQEKMQEYLDSGLRLGWLIDPQNEQVEIYRSIVSIDRSGEIPSSAFRRGRATWFRSEFVRKKQPIDNSIDCPN
ncbi:hypothetical protein LEP3755_20340 [Leptolyngbya sp. NIES-3755]|nr:hypothetical protein LEP3755_20340 [Leptolyngbya sp. NIES-3755]